MNWTELTNNEQLEQLLTESRQQPVVIFKHSTRCSISAMALGRLQREEPPANARFYYLDVIASRPMSNRVAELFSVHHESPQVLLIKNGECVYEESHNGINMDEIAEQAA